MKKICLNAHGKINLALDIVGQRDDGYHLVEMVMAQIGLSDCLCLEYKPSDNASLDIQLTVDDDCLAGKDNLAYIGAQRMVERYGKEKKGVISIDIQKNIPVAAGLAGGSADGAAVLHGMNYLWNLNLPLSRLCEIGSSLGADVPFCLVAQSKTNKLLGLHKDALSSTCAFAHGIGTELVPLPSIKGYVVTSTPEIAVSTQKVFQAMDSISIIGRKNISQLVRGFWDNDFGKITENMYNVLELFTINKYDKVMYTKNNMVQFGQNGKVLMSGSGPTIFFITQDIVEAKEVKRKMEKINKQTFLTELV